MHEKCCVLNTNVDLGRVVGGCGCDMWRWLASVGAENWQFVISDRGSAVVSGVLKMAWNVHVMVCEWCEWCLSSTTIFLLFFRIFGGFLWSFWVRWGCGAPVKIARSSLALRSLLCVCVCVCWRETHALRYHERNREVSRRAQHADKARSRACSLWRLRGSSTAAAPYLDMPVTLPVDFIKNNKVLVIIIA